MKSCIAAVALVSAFAVLAGAQEKSISGQWKVQIAVAGNDAEFSCNITQEAATLKGSCSAIGERNGSAKDGVYT